MAQPRPEESLELLIAQYLESIDAGVEIDIDRFILQHPDYADELRRHFENVAIFEEFAVANLSSGEDPRFPDADDSQSRRVALTPRTGVGETPAGSAGTRRGVLNIPEEFGRYRILKLLGQGSMGAVYVAHDTQLDRSVAIKVPHFDLSVAGELVERFHREARAAARLRHPNICPVHDVGEVDGQPYISMALIDGFTLRDIARSGAAQSQHEVALVMRKLAMALAEAHRQGIIHRDLKSANIMVDRSGEPIVMDFGLARGASVDEADVTQTGVILGTPAYMSPEQVRSDQQSIGPASDIYSLGVVLYELLTGQLPFTGTLHGILQQILTDEPQLPSKIRADLDRRLEAICLKAMAKRTQDRYQSMHELAEDLRCYLAHKPTLARPAGPVQRIRKWLQRHPTKAVSAGGVAMTAVISAALIAWAVRERDAAIDADHGTVEARMNANRQLAETALAETLLAADQQGAEVAILHLARTLQLAVDAEDHELELSIRRQLGAWRQDLRELESVYAHGGDLFAVAISHDEELVATGGSDQSVRIWKATTGEPVGKPITHDGIVYAVAFSPDGRRLLSGSGDGTARIWDVETGQAQGPPLRHAGRVLAVAFSPDGTQALTGSDEKLARLWDPKTGAPVGSPLVHQDIVRCVAFSPDGRRILTGGDDHTARLWETATQRQTGRIFRHRDAIFAAAFSPDGARILTGSSDGTAQLWHVETGEEIGPALLHHGRVLAAGISPDNHTMATAGLDRNVRFWSLETGEFLGHVQHADVVRAVAYSPRGDFLITIGREGNARRWRTMSAVRLQNALPVRAAVFSRNGESLYTCGSRSVRKWDTATGQLLATIMEQQQWVFAGAFSPDGNTVLSCYEDGTADLFEIASGRASPRSLQPLEHIRIGAFSPDSRWLVTGSLDGIARLWDAATGRSVGKPLEHGGATITDVVFSPDGRMVFTVARGDSVRVWDVPTGQPLDASLRMTDAVLSVAGNLGNSRIATAGQGGQVRLWDAGSGQPIGPSFPVRGTTRVVRFNPDGSVLLTGGDDRSACLWDVARGIRIGPRFVHPSGVESVDVSPDGQTLLTRCHDLSVWLRPLFPPVAGTPQEVTLWTQVITGMELDDQGHTHMIDPVTWVKLREELAAFR